MSTPDQRQRLHIRDQDMRRCWIKPPPHAHMSVSELVLRHAVNRRSRSYRRMRPSPCRKMISPQHSWMHPDEPHQTNPALQRAFATRHKTCRKWPMPFVRLTAMQTEVHLWRDKARRILVNYASRDIKRGVARVFVASPTGMSSRSPVFTSPSAASIAAETLHKPGVKLPPARCRWRAAVVLAVAGSSKVGAGLHRAIPMPASASVLPVKRWAWPPSLLMPNPPSSQLLSAFRFHSSPVQPSRWMPRYLWEWSKTRPR